MSIPSTVNYPASYDDDNTLFADPVNNLSFTLAANIDAADTVVSVTGDLTQVAAPCFLAFATGELVYAESWNSGASEFTVIRSSSPVSHLAGETLRLTAAAEYFTQLKNAIIAIQTTLGLSPHGAFSDVGNRIDDAESRLDTAEANIPTLDTRMTDAEGRLDNIETVLSTPANMTPTGAISPFGGSSAPAGWLLCNGAAVSRTTYADLFGVIGTTFGTGDGSTTFNLPNLNGRVPVGAGLGTGLTNRVLGATGGEEDHVLTVDEIPQHNHTMGVFNRTSGLPAWEWGTDQADGALESSTTGSTGSGDAHNNMQPYLVTQYIIKV
jgi:microcystin-dependent protein